MRLDCISSFLATAQLTNLDITIGPLSFTSCNSNRVYCKWCIHFSHIPSSSSSLHEPRIIGFSPPPSYRTYEGADFFLLPSGLSSVVLINVTCKSDPSTSVRDTANTPVRWNSTERTPRGSTFYESVSFAGLFFKGGGIRDQHVDGR